MFTARGAVVIALLSIASYDGLKVDIFLNWTSAVVLVVVKCVIQAVSWSESDYLILIDKNRDDDCISVDITECHPRDWLLQLISNSFAISVVIYYHCTELMYYST